MLINDLKEKFPLNEKEILSFINSAPNRYKLYNIKKRHGGMREIAEPTKSLKILQSWALNKYLSKYNIHPSAIAYVKNKNIKDFVLPHSNNRYLLKIDLSSFSLLLSSISPCILTLLILEFLKRSMIL